MGYLIHTLLHFLVGASISYLTFNKDFQSKIKRGIILCFGGVAAVLPDITKFFGDILGHTIWFAPILGLLFAIGSRIFVKEASFKKTWFIFTLTVLLGHIFIDFIGNGVSFLHPFIKKEYDFNIVGRNDTFVISTLFFAVTIGLFYRKGRKIILVGVLFVVLYLGTLSASKIQLEQTLKRQYSGDNITLLLTYPSHDFRWNFMVRTDKVWVSGYSPILGTDIHIENKTNVSAD